MKNLMQEALDELQRRNAPDPAQTYDAATVRRIESDINAQLRESFQNSREIQARSEVSAAKLFLTF